jgi:putative nucleotidyltransferase with HDIG domain
MKTMDDILESIGALPPLPDTALRLMSMLNDPRSTLDDIVEVIRYDQSVTSEVLRLCNSAYFGLSRQVASLNEAMLRLGTVKVLQMVMSVHTSAMLGQEQEGYGLEPGVLWKHSVAVALASSIIAQRVALPNANLVFTAGLLHDIGKVVLNRYVASEFAEIVRRVTDERLSFSEAEERVLGFSHEQIGGIVAERWRLPEPIVRCIRYHHEPGALTPPDPLVDAVYLANTVCLLLGIGLGADGLCHRADEAVMERHNLGEQDVERVGVQLMTELKSVEQSFAESADKAMAEGIAQK